MKTINRTVVISGIILGTLLFLNCKGSSETETGKDAGKPNFIIWVADDQFLESVGCYGGDPAQTPNIDKLAREGLRFTRAYSTSSICTPARSALYTGMYPIKNGAHPNHSGLKEDIPSMPGIMGELGYRTAIVGKHGVHDVPTRPSNTLLLSITSAISSILRILGFSRRTFQY